MRASSIARTLLPLGLCLALTVPAATAGDARVLDELGRVLTVGNWQTVHVDGGPLRVPTGLVLSWELRDAAGQLLGEGIVPGTQDLEADTGPVLSRNPATQEVLLAWSRSTVWGTQQLVSTVWRDGAWVQLEAGPGGPLPDVRVLAGGPGDQSDPSLIHDRDGHAYLVWRSSQTSTIEMLTLGIERQEIDRERLSTDDVVHVGPPVLGVDPLGAVFVGYLALETLGTVPVLQVHEPADAGGGVLHVSSPIIELGRIQVVPVEDAVPEVPDQQPGAWEPPALRASVLGGTPVVWWIGEDELGRPVLHHVVRAPGGSWTEIPRGRVALATLGDPATALSDALAMIEARYRSVVSLVDVTPPARDPQPLPLPGLLRRR